MATPMPASACCGGGCTGYAGAPGEVLRGALGSDHLRIVLRRLGHIRHAAVVIAWWLGLAGLALVGCPWWVMAALVVVPLAFWRGGADHCGWGLSAFCNGR
jgi:hypothetical protein